jgi:AraC-like DNA-binding protein
MAMGHDSPDIPGTLSNLQLIAHVSALDALGVDTDRVLEIIGLPRARFSDPTGRSPLGVDFPLWAATVEVCGDPAIGLRAGQQISYEALGGYGYLLRNSESFEQLLERASKYMRLIDDLCCIDWRIEGERCLTRVSRTGDYPIPNEAIDCLFAAIAGVMRELVPHEIFADARVRIAHDSPLSSEVYERYIGCKVELGAAHHELEAPKRWLDERPHFADLKLGEVLQQHATTMLESMPETDVVLQTARAKLVTQLAGGEVGLGALARAMHMSERTLRRRLAERGTSYQTLLDELRSTQARKLVGSGGEPVDQIAQRLGFSDTSSFFHAFKRWTGQTPAQFRRALRPVR